MLRKFLVTQSTEESPMMKKAGIIGEAEGVEDENVKEINLGDSAGLLMCPLRDLCR